MTLSSLNFSEVMSIFEVTKYMESKYLLTNNNMVDDNLQLTFVLINIIWTLTDDSLFKQVIELPFRSAVRLLVDRIEINVKSETHEMFKVVEMTVTEVTVPTGPRTWTWWFIVLCCRGESIHHFNRVALVLQFTAKDPPRHTYTTPEGSRFNVRVAGNIL